MRRLHAALPITLFLVLLSWRVASAQVEMPGGAQYGIRIPSKIAGCYAPVASNLIGSDEKDHSGRGSPTLAYDWSASVGTPVFSICPGTVRKTRASPGTSEGGYGWHIVIDHGNGVSTLYAHCQENSFLVRPGDAVTAWTPICRVGRTGMTSWPHVHLNVEVNGGYTKVGQYFDASLIRYCHFTQCQATNKPDDPIFTDGQTVEAVQTTGGSATVGEARIYTLLRSLKGVKPEQLISAYFIFFLSIGFLLWLGTNLVRMVVIGILTGAATAFVIVWLFVPPLATAAAPASPSVGGGNWEAAYEVVQGREGWKCTNDGAYTMGGVTQGAYNRWRRLHGMGTADVCANLTRAQAKAIFYELYWLEIGAEQLPFKLALTAVDHYYNTGAVRHLLAQCGQDVACFNRARIADYNTKGNCSLYCTAWIDRVNHLRSLTER